MKKMFITGGNGNLGRLLADRMLTHGIEVIRFDLPGSFVGDPTDGQIIEFGDVRDTELLQQLFSKHQPDSVCHLASLLSGSSESDLQISWEINATASFQLLQLSMQHKVDRFLFASTIATYGDVSENPMSEDYPQWPHSMYGATKVAVERLGHYFKVKHGLDFRCLRFPLVISPFAPKTAVSAYPSHALLAAAKGESFVFPVSADTGISTMFLGDVIDSMEQFLLADSSCNRRPVYNVDSYYMTAQMAADAITAAFPDFTYSFEPVANVDALIAGWPDRVDNSPAQQDWGWQASCDLDGSIRGILKMIENG
ncbi:MAG: threonine 3-dehydrogenase [Parasphingorhabdus sp.]|jgi:threonine 3-dehydrogenase